MKPRLIIILFIFLTGFYSRTGICQVPEWIMNGRENIPVVSVAGSFQVSEYAFDYKGDRYQIGKYRTWSVITSVWLPVAGQVALYTHLPVWQQHSLSSKDRIPGSNTEGMGDPVFGLAYENPFQAVTILLAGEMTFPIASSGRFDNPVPLGSGELKYAFHLQMQPNSSSGPLFWKIQATGELRDLNRNHTALVGAGFYYRYGRENMIGCPVTYQFPIGKIEATDPAINGLSNGVSGLTVQPGGLVLLTREIGIHYQVRIPVTGGNRSSGLVWLAGVLVPI